MVLRFPPRAQPGQIACGVLPVGVCPVTAGLFASTAETNVIQLMQCASSALQDLNSMARLTASTTERGASRASSIGPNTRHGPSSFGVRHAHHLTDIGSPVSAVEGIYVNLEVSNMNEYRIYR
jgi:hypothetical protein